MPTFHSADNPQSVYLPPRLPSAGREIAELLQAVCFDQQFPVSVRVECLHILLDRTQGERPTLVTSRFLSRICYQTAKLLKESPPQGGFTPPEVHNLFSTLRENILPLIGKFSSQDVANTAWALATLKIADSKLCEALSYRARQVIAEFNPQALSSTAWAFATLNVTDTELFEALSHRARQYITEFPPQAIAVTAWAFAVNNPELVGGIASADHLRMDRYSDIQWLQIYQALVGAGLEGSLDCALPRYDSIVSRHVPSKPSRFEKSVGLALRSVLSAIPFSIEFGKIFAGVVTDWTVEFNDRKIVVECDGAAFHTTQGPDPHRLLGSDILQDRIFAHFGYEAIHLHQPDWYKAPDKLALLCDKLGLSETNSSNKNAGG